MDMKFVPISLPSKCLTYESVDPKAVQIRPFTGSEEELIRELDVSNLKGKLIQIISRVLRGVPVEHLTAGDAQHVVVWEAINSYSNMYPVRLICENCTQRIDVQVNLGEIESKELPEDFVQPQEIILSAEKIKLRLLTLTDEERLFDMSIKGLPTYLAGYALSIVDSELTTDAWIEKLKVMDTKGDLTKIRSWHAKYSHGPDMIAPYVCPKCKGGGFVQVPFRFDRLLQSVSQSGIPVRTEVQFAV